MIPLMDTLMSNHEGKTVKLGVCIPYGTIAKYILKVMICFSSYTIVE